MMKFSLVLFFLFLSVSGFAQQNNFFTGGNEKSNYNTVADFQKHYLYNMYYNEVNDVDELINGREYIPYYYRAKLKPILFNKRKHTASVDLNGRIYDSISLQYDTYLDELVYVDSTRVINLNIYQIALNKDPIEGFGLYFGYDSLFFRHFNSEKVHDFNLPEGFYEVVYNGKSKYIIKHQSVAIEKEGIDEYYYRPAAYISLGEGFYKIRSSKGFIKLFGEKSNEMKKYLQVNRINTRKADKKQIVKVLKYYDSLVSSENQTK
jgi:hypothetical protein